MNILLIFFAIPIAVIIFSIALQKILKCPILVAAIIFAVFLIITFAVFDATFLVFTIIYTIIAFITAFIVKIICNLINKKHNNISCSCLEERLEESNTNSENVNTISNSRQMGTFCGCYRRR